MTPRRNSDADTDLPVNPHSDCEPLPPPEPTLEERGIRMPVIHPPPPHFYPPPEK